MKKTSLFILGFLFMVSLGWGATTTVDFETADDGYTATGAYGTGNTDLFNRTNTAAGSNTGYYWAAQDMNTGTFELNLTQIDITSATTFSFSIDFLTPNSEEWDVGDELLITYSIDSGASQNLMWVQSNDDGDAYNAPAALDLDFDGTGDDGEELPAIADDFGAGVGSDFETFITSSISLSSNSTLDITLQFNGLTSGDEGIYLDNIIVIGSTSSTPTITLSESSLNGFSYVVGSGPSAEQTFTAQGSDLTANITITAPTNYEISETSGSGYTSPIVLTQSGGAVASTTIYTRLKSGLSVGSYDSEDITASSTGATNKTVTCSGDVTAVVPNFVINEIQADPDATNGDANGDGSVNTSEDEFVEIVNRNGNAVDISGWMIYDASSLRHTIPASTTIQNDQALVVFGGGSPDASIPGIVQTASAGYLSFNNGGDDVILKNSTGQTVVSYTYGTEGGDNQSIARNPDFTGSFVKHTTIDTNPVLFSPGRNNVNGTPLPVTLSDFSTAIIMNEFVQISWTTQTESSINTWNLYRSSENSTEQILLNTQYGTNTAQPNTYTFDDHEVDEDVTYYYYLEVNEYDGTSNLWGPITAMMEGSGTPELPTTSMLNSNYPNPFNPSTIISCEVKEGEEGKFTIYNSRGQVVESQTLNAGEHIIEWDGTQYGSGVYLYKLETMSYTKTRKMMMIK